MQKFVWETFATRDGFFELFVSVNSGKVKLRVQLRVVASSLRALELEHGICGLFADIPPVFTRVTSVKELL
jgi:hypothetical protein